MVMDRGQTGMGWKTDGMEDGADWERMGEVWTGMGTGRDSMGAEQ